MTSNSICDFVLSLLLQFFCGYYHYVCLLHSSENASIVLVFQFMKTRMGIMEE